MITARHYVPILLIFTAIVFTGVGCSKKDQANGYLFRANRDFEAQQYQEAEIDYRTLPQVAPMNPVAIGRQGVIYYDQGRLSQASAYLQKAAELEPENVEVQLRLGLTALHSYRRS